MALFQYRQTIRRSEFRHIKYSSKSSLDNPSAASLYTQLVRAWSPIAYVRLRPLHCSICVVIESAPYVVMANTSTTKPRYIPDCQAAAFLGDETDWAEIDKLRLKSLLVSG